MGDNQNRRKRGVTADEKALWRLVMQDAAPLPGRDLPPPGADPVPDAPLAAPAPKPPIPPLFTPDEPARRPAPPPPLTHGAVIGLDKRSGERLKRGDLAIEGRLDLHGMTQDQAHGALIAFVGRAHDAGKRCVLVITGKGGRLGGEMGVLRASVPRWLNESPLRGRVLAFSHAQARHGGEGALYVLLKRRR